MPESQQLSDIQKEAAKSLANGVSQSVTAKLLGVSRETVNRWAKANTEFQAEVERRKRQKRQDSIVLNTPSVLPSTDTEDSQAYLENLKRYRDARGEIYAAQLKAGRELLTKVQQRVADLPIEAIAPNSIAPITSVANDTIKQGMDGWAELLAIDSLIERMSGKGGGS